MVGIARVGTASPCWVVEGRPALGPDEDALTLAASAAEAALGEGGPHAPPPTSIDLVGALPSEAEWALPQLVGAPGPAQHAESITEAIARRETLAGTESALVIEVYGLAESPPTPGPFAVALLLQEGGGWALRRTTARSGPSRSTAESLRLLQGHEVADAIEIGPGTGPCFEIREQRPIPWGPPPDGRAEGSGPSISRDALDRLARVPLGRVSEGAYISRARYLESLPARWRLLAERCPTCGKRTFPSRGECAKCGNRVSLTTEPLPRDGGRVVALTTIHRGGQPTEFDPLVEAVGAYSVAIVELAEGCRATFQVTDAPPGALAIGDRVSTRLRRLYPMEGEWRYGRKAVPFVGRPMQPGTS